MDVVELMQAVETEGLNVPVIYGVGVVRNDAVAVDFEGGVWRVYLFNERGGIVESTLREFDNESAAFEHVLRKLRQVQAADRAMARMASRRAADTTP